MHSHILQTLVDLMVIPKKRFKFFFWKLYFFPSLEILIFFFQSKNGVAKIWDYLPTGGMAKKNYDFVFGEIQE